MKKYLLVAVLVFSSIACLANENPAKSITYLKAGGGWNIQVFGQKLSSAYVDALFSNFPNTKKKGYVWTFKNIAIEGIDKKVNFQVHQGISGKNSNGSNYFHTFTSEKYKQQLLSRQQEGEKAAIIIYVKDGRKHPLTTREEAKLVEDFLQGLLG